MFTLRIAILSVQFSLLIARSDIQPRSLGDTDACESLNSCSECLRQERCQWCPVQRNSPFGERIPQCTDSENSDVACPLEPMRSTIATQLLVSKNEGLGHGSRGRQLQPQELSLRIGPNVPETIRVKYKRVEGYPVDLYFILDSSTSMNRTKNILVNLAGILGETIGQITGDYRLGFGSFIEKPISPFMSQKQIRDNKAYSFQHHMKLSKAPSEFADKVRESATYDNLDTPEAGLEALMQAATCKEQIGWRDHSQRLIIFSTDSSYHISGDGKLAGLLVPNDEKCHLVKNSSVNFLYFLNQLLDYPSVSQISRQISANSINIIFAVPSSVSGVYKELVSRLVGSSVGELSNDSSNIVDLIRDQYNRINSNVKLSHRAPEGIEVKYSSTCQKKGGNAISTNECAHIKPGTEVEFDVTITVKKCQNTSRSFRDKIEIFPVGVNEVLTVDVDVMCDCDCDLSPVDTSAAKFCEAQELSKCSVCECDPSVFKPACPVSPVNNQTCGGAEHGLCKCESNGKCECAVGWTGNSCDCPISDSDCKNLEGEVCSRRGKCNCGKCDCDKTDGGVFTGKYCETRPVLCMGFRDCVRCQAFKTGLSEEECSMCPFNITLHDEVQENGEDEELCSVQDESHCNIIFVYRRSRPEDNVRVRMLKVCTEPVNVVAIIAGVMGAVLGVGLLLLLAWKILTTVHDRLEYAKFLEERAKAKWQRDENPLYKRPTTVFRNPSYAASSDEVNM